MPWKEKAQGLLRTHYAATGNSGRGSLNAVVNALELACTRKNLYFDVGDTTSGQNVDPKELLARFKAEQEDIGKHIDAYREYC